MSNQKNRKLLQSSESQSEQEVVEVSIKKNPQITPKIQTKTPKLKPIKKPESKPKITQQLKQLLEQKINDQKLLKQLQKGPLNFGDQEKTNNKKILLIEQNVKTQKKQTKTGISLVFQKKALPRKGTNRMADIMAKCNSFRGNMDVIRTVKSSKA